MMVSQRNSTPRRRAGRCNNLMFCAALGVTLSVLSQGSAVLAQTKSMDLPLAQFGTNDDPFSSFGSDESPGIPWHSWPMETTMLLLVFLASSLFCFLVLFDYLLRHKRWWPLTAYGFCAGIVLAITLGFAEWIFWEDLVFRGPQGTTWLMEYGGRAGLLVIGLLILSLVMYGIRSEHGRAVAKQN